MLYFIIFKSAISGVETVLELESNPSEAIKKAQIEAEKHTGTFNRIWVNALTSEQFKAKWNPRNTGKCLYDSAMFQDGYEWLNEKCTKNLIDLLAA